MKIDERILHAHEKDQSTLADSKVPELIIATGLKSFNHLSLNFNKINQMSKI